MLLPLETLIPMEQDEIRKQLLEDNAYFKRVLNLIPTHFYFDHETKQKLKGDDLEESEFTGRKHGKKRHVEDPAEKAAWKRKKFDPNQIQTVTDIQEQLVEAEHKEEKAKKKKKKSHTDAIDSEPSSHEHLKEKIHSKIAEMQAKRKAFKSEDSLEKIRMKRRERKLALKMKKKEKQHNSKIADMKTSGKKTPTPSKSPSKKPVYNKEGKIVFSKFDFTDSGTKDKAQKDTLTGKNYKQLLEKVNRQKEKINKLKETDSMKAKDLESKVQWKNVMQKAEGLKVKDNPELIKKALKRKEKMKDKRKKGWDERKSKLETQMKAQQDKRKDNIQKRKKSKVDKKIKKAKKKGRMIPGF